MSNRQLLSGLKELQSAIAFRNEADARISQIATKLIRSLEGVSTPSTARKGKGKTEAELRQMLYKNRIKH